MKNYINTMEDRESRMYDDDHLQRILRREEYMPREKERTYNESGTRTYTQSSYTKPSEYFVG
jgi:hypothetical protein